MPRQHSHADFVAQRYGERGGVLPQNARTALLLYYGLEDNRRRTLEETGEMMGVSGARASQLVNHARGLLGVGRIGRQYAQAAYWEVRRKEEQVERLFDVAERHRRRLEDAERRLIDARRELSESRANPLLRDLTKEDIEKLNSEWQTRRRRE